MNNADRRRQFKLGFLTKLAEVGMTPGEFYTRMEKAGILNLQDALLLGAGTALKNRAGKVVDLVDDVPRYGAQAAIGVPAVVGGGLGLAQGLMEAPADTDVSLLHKAEQIGQYRKLTDEIRKRTQKQEAPHVLRRR